MINTIVMGILVLTPNFFSLVVVIVLQSKIQDYISYIFIYICYDMHKYYL